MKCKVVRWGNSLAIRIPKPLARQAGLAEGKFVNLSCMNRQLVVDSIEGPLSLDMLLRGVTDQNVHGEWDTGPRTGKEIW